MIDFGLLEDEVYPKPDMRYSVKELSAAPLSDQLEPETIRLSSDVKIIWTME